MQFFFWKKINKLFAKRRSEALFANNFAIEVEIKGKKSNKVVERK